MGSFIKLDSSCLFVLFVWGFYGGGGDGGGGGGGGLVGVFSVDLV